MTAQIKGYEQPIAKIFSNDFLFEIPLYQRPYAWTEENAEELFLDILNFVEGGQAIESIDPYFLGSIVLVKDDNVPDSKVVDGQQRLTTLTILLAVLRALAKPEDRKHLTQFLYEEGNPLTQTEDRYRLTLREKDQGFFEQYIQSDPEGVYALEKNVEPKKLATDSQRLIRANALHLKGYLEALNLEERNRYAQFVLTRCFLVVVSTPKRDTAYRVFSVLNDRGLDLAATDILKAEIIGVIDPKLQDKYTKKWETQEDMLGRDAFEDLFAHIRMIRRKVKAQETMLEEIRQHIKPHERPTDFIDTVVLPYADAFYDVINATFDSTDIETARQLNELFRALNRIDNVDWIPPAILHLSEHQNEPGKLLRFFTDLERLASGMMILRHYLNTRLQRYGRVLTYIEEGKDLYEPNSPLQLTDIECREILRTLSGPAYGEKWSRYVLLRLDGLAATGEARYDYNVLTVEHVLPQQPSADSIWTKWFDVPERYVNILGNLVLLSRRKNSQASNYDFTKKKDEYFRSGDAAPFALTAQVLKQDTWTVEVLKDRQTRLLDLLINEWRLDNWDGVRNFDWEQVLLELEEAEV